MSQMSVREDADEEDENAGRERRNTRYNERHRPKRGPSSGILRDFDLGPITEKQHREASHENAGLLKLTLLCPHAQNL